MMPYEAHRCPTVCSGADQRKHESSGLCEGNLPVTSEFPSQRASNAEMFSFDDIIMSPWANKNFNFLNKKIYKRLSSQLRDSLNSTGYFKLWHYFKVYPRNIAIIFLNKGLIFDVSPDFFIMKSYDRRVTDVTDESVCNYLYYLGGHRVSRSSLVESETEK